MSEKDENGDPTDISDEEKSSTEEPKQELPFEMGVTEDELPISGDETKEDDNRADSPDIDIENSELSNENVDKSIDDDIVNEGDDRDVDGAITQSNVDIDEAEAGSSGNVASEDTKTPKKSDDDNPTDSEDLLDSDRTDQVMLETNELEKPIEDLTHEEVEEENKIPDDFFYETDGHFSKATVTEDSGIPLNLLSVKKCFGYDCTRRTNLHILEEGIFLMAAGNVINIMNTITKEETLVRTLSGRGIGAVAVDPSLAYIAVAEKGYKPNIAVYEYPSMRLHRILREGTECAYSCISFDPQGGMLSSVGSAPDFMLTIWDWKQEKIILRTKAFSQDVNHVTFSPDNEGFLTTCGLGHIRFWKMATTFTGLKLEGAIGRFGKTELSDIEGYTEMPDGKVLSGCEWGNMLLWEGGLIKVQICRTGGKPCHQGPIQQLLIDEGEIITLGSDGWIRVWQFETLDMADTHDDTGRFEMDPMNELKVGNDVWLQHMVKSLIQEESFWYAQDAHGGIWKLDLSFTNITKAPEKLYSCSAGGILDMDVSPIGNLVSTIAKDGSVRLYDYLQETQLAEAKYASDGCSLVWYPESLDSTANSLVAGFADGVVRIITLERKTVRSRVGPQYDLILKHVLKPHSRRVTKLLFNSEKTRFVTGSSDSTVFFFDIVDDVICPIGFARVPDSVADIMWSPYSPDLVICLCELGDVVQLEFPVANEVDTKRTYFIDGLVKKTFKFKTIKERLNMQKCKDLWDKEQARKKKTKEAARAKELERLKARGIDEPLPEDEEAEVVEEFAYEPLEPSDEVSKGMFIFPCEDDDTFWLSMSGFETGYLYKCRFADSDEQAAMETHGEPFEAFPLEDLDDVAVTNLRLSKSGNRVFMGLSNGSLRIASKKESGALSDIFANWTLSMHDNDNGSINKIMPSFDESFVFSIGNDGNFFSYDLLTEETVAKAMTDARLFSPRLRKPDEPLLDDIDDPAAYSIEESKQKAEYDKMMRIAEEKKVGVRRQVATMRKTFNKLLEQNSDLPEHLKLDRREFELDPEMRRQIKRETVDRLEMLQKEMAWESEKHLIALNKLQTRFKDGMDYEMVTVVTFDGQDEVTVFRHTKIPDYVKQLRQNIEEKQLTSKFQRTKTKDLPSGVESKDGPPEEVLLNKEDPERKEHDGTTKAAVGDHIAKALQKIEALRKRKQRRQVQWNELNAMKPPDDFEDPGDVMRIKEATDNMGDFKLKTSLDYVVPDVLRINAEKKLCQLFSLQDLIFKMKHDYNEKLVTLRDKKKLIMSQYNKFVEDLDEIHGQLDQSKWKTIPVLLPLRKDEVPEDAYVYNNRVLENFVKTNDEKLYETLKGDEGELIVSSNGMNSSHREPSKPSSAASKLSVFRMAGSSRHNMGSRIKHIVDLKERPLNTLEKKKNEERMTMALFQQQQILVKMADLVSTFDGHVRRMKRVKYGMEVRLKLADLRNVTLFQEYLLLKEFEKRDEVLGERVSERELEKYDMEKRVQDTQSRHEAKQNDYAKIQEKESALFSQFQDLVSESKFSDFLLRVFKKKIKRKKAKLTDDEEEESDEESDSDESDWSSEENDEDEEGKEKLHDNVCPPGCEQELFDQTCELREARIDVEEMLADEKRARDVLQKELDNLTKKIKIIGLNLKNAEMDLEAFQTEKQRKMNELQVVVPLTLKQIEYFQKGAVPAELSQCLVFLSESLDRLKSRIKELHHEKLNERKKQKESRKQHVQLNKDRKFLENMKTEWEDKCNETMMLKFGRLIDLEKMQSVQVNRAIEEMKEKLRVHELKCASEVREMDRNVDCMRLKMVQVIKQNTLRLEQYAQLLDDQRSVEEVLDSKQKKLGGEYDGRKNSDLREKQRLIQLVQLQAQEVEALKDEISLLSRKGGHILPPTQPPVPPQTHLANAGLYQ